MPELAMVVGCCASLPGGLGFMDKSAMESCYTVIKYMCVRVHARLKRSLSGRILNIVCLE